MGAHLWRMRHCVGSQFQRFAWLLALFLSVIFQVQRNSRLRRRMLWSTCGVCVREFHWLDLHRPFCMVDVGKSFLCFVGSDPHRATCCMRNAYALETASLRVHPSSCNGSASYIAHSVFFVDQRASSMS